MFLCSQISNVV